jgi:hypothetical protein
MLSFERQENPLSGPANQLVDGPWYQACSPPLVPRHNRCAAGLRKRSILNLVRASGRLTYAKAPMPVMARPTMSVCMVSVPSKVWIASRSTMCRATW